MDVVDGEISRATTSADEFFYAQRLIDTEVNSVSYPRPPLLEDAHPTPIVLLSIVTVICSILSNQLF